MQHEVDNPVSLSVRLTIPEHKRFAMSPVTTYTKTSYIRHLQSENKYDAIEELARVFEGDGICENIDSLVSALKEREEIMSTGIGFGIAIPHAKINSVNEMAFAIGISQKGIDFDSMDGNPVFLMILVAAGEKQHKKYLKLLSSIMAILKDEKNRERIITSAPEEIISILHQEETVE